MEERLKCIFNKSAPARESAIIDIAFNMIYDQGYVH